MTIYVEKFGKIVRIPHENKENPYDSILSILKSQNEDIRFFLDYLPSEVVVNYDFNEKSSTRSFIDLCNSIDSPLMKMGAISIFPNIFEEDSQTPSIVISDPYKKIPGSFQIVNEVVVYNPSYPHFSDERDLIKVANKSYFTTEQFEEIIKKLIKAASKFYVNESGESRTRNVNQKGKIPLKEITKEEMLEYISNPEKGKLIKKRELK